MRFREQVRSPEWQREFLARPLAQRQAIARELREQSESRKNSSLAYADVDGPAALAWLEAADGHAMIHGHTHKPAEHLLGGGTRTVLSDWDAAAEPPRLEALRLTAHGARRIPLT
jgi:UDP-2,3-diacylglucosamine hydrolase